LHTRAAVLDDIARLRAAGITNINIDLIAGLPHQTAASWQTSLDETIAAGVPHASIYMLEVDEDSRLGRELIAGGTRYHAHFVPDEHAVADFYEQACARLGAAGIAQYEISNFARPRMESRHNLKYWTRQPYVGFGLDAHSMLEGPDGAVRFSTPDSLEDFMAGAPLSRTPVSTRDALEEAFFLGLRLTRGMDLKAASARFGVDALRALDDTIGELATSGMLEREGDIVRLTPAGRLLSNEVFQRFLGVPAK
ncbi:MAG: coproporphyrinogen III oxidase family protein, partial [Terriglobales bacterium]